MLLQRLRHAAARNVDKVGLLRNPKTPRQPAPNEG
jgi:hypothetical protein